MPNKSARKSEQVVLLWSSIPKSKGNTKSNEQINISLYNFILQHQQVTKSPIYNDCLKVSIDGNSEPQLVPKVLPQMSARELHNSMSIPPEEGGIKEERDSDNNIIISDSTLRSVITPQLKKISARYKVMCGF